jgi:hypothetical protein
MTAKTATACKHAASEMEDEPRDFAVLPKTSPHFNTQLILPPPAPARLHQLAVSGGPGHEDHDNRRAAKLSFAPIFAPVEIIPYGADRVLFVEGLICEYARSPLRSVHSIQGSKNISYFLRFSLTFWCGLLWQGLLPWVGGRPHTGTTLCHPYACTDPEQVTLTRKGGL